MKIRVNKTVYDVEAIDARTERGFDYTVYRLRKKNTVKTLTHNTTTNSFTLWGGTKSRPTMTTPAAVDFI